MSSNNLEPVRTFIRIIFRLFDLDFNWLTQQICWWDSRKGGNPDGMIPMDQCHIDPVYKTIWLNAKQGTEFFTGSTDGMVSKGRYLFFYIFYLFNT